MNSDTPVDYALFQLSPRRSRCELFVSADGKTEKLASGFLKPFVTHLKVAEEQVAQAGQTIKLEVNKKKNSAIWFNKGTLERFVRFVSTPDVLELVNTFDAEMIQLEGARTIYSQGAADPLSGSTGENERSTASNADITKTELLKAIEVRLLALKQELSMACGRASAAGFTLDNISELLLFSDHFGAYRLNKACTNFISLYQRRPELLTHQHHRSPPSQQQQWKEDRDLCSSSSSDMSIDNNPDDTNTTATSLKHTKTCQATTQKSAPEQQLVESERNGDLLSGLTQPLPPAGGTRRLSVQDRINLFENKQKEQLGGGGGGGSKIGGKVELRRLSSDISSSVEKSVLRRWSGASDMSIDLNSNNSCSGMKEVESTATTPSSSFNTQTHTASRNVENDTAASQPGSGSDDRPSRLSSSSFSSSSTLLQAQTQTGSFSKDRDHSHGTYLKDQAALSTDSTQLKSMSEKELFDSKGSSRVESVEQRGPSNFQNLSKVSLDVEEHAELNKDQFAAASHLTGVSLKKGLTGEKSAPEGYEASKIPHNGCLTNKLNRLGSIEAELAVPSVGTVSGSASIAQFRVSESRNEDTVSNKKAASKSQSQPKTFQGTVENTQLKSSQFPSELRGENFTCKSEEMNKRGDHWQVQSGGFLSKVRREEHSGGTSLKQQDMKLHRQTSDLDQTRKSQCKRDERKPQSNVLPVSIGRKPKVSEEALELNSAPSVGSVHITKPSKGKHELNNELQMKADELEKLFAAHKLRVPGDQTASTHRIKPADPQADSTSKDKTQPVDFLPECMPVKDSNTFMDAGMKSDANMLVKMLDNQDYIYGSTHKLGDISSLDDVRGRFYERYMEKRDAKLQEEWGSKRAQKEAIMKAMQDNLERCRAELRARFSGSAKRSDSTVFSRQRAEKLRNYNARVVMKNKEQQSVDFQQNKGEDAQEACEQRGYGDDRFLSETPPSDCSLKSSYSKRPLPNKSAASSTPRNTGAALSGASQQTNSGPGRHRIQPENPLAHSVSNFSDMQKENTKTPPGANRIATHARARNSTRGKSISEEMVFDKEDKPCNSQSIRKNFSNPIELKDNSTINSKEQNNQKQKKKGMESRTFLRKGNGIGPGSGAGKLRASIVSGKLRSEENSEELAAQMEIPQGMVTQDDEFEVRSARELSRTGNEKPRLSEDSVHSCDQELQNGEILESFSQVDDDSTAELAATAFRIHNSTATMHDSPGESPLSWNSRIHHSFSYAQEASDIDASVESPLGSPPSWNSHPLKQMTETDASRIRKKWGSAQKPIIVANTSHWPRKDVTRGFKRLLKFGKKNKGADNLINDWISASTNSEGDDDVEDGYDPVNRVSDDVQKSRTGFPQLHSAYDGFNEGEIFQYQAQAFHSSISGAPATLRMREDQLSGSSLKAPRSFFSFSTFRGKGSDSKSR